MNEQLSLLDPAVEEALLPVSRELKSQDMTLQESASRDVQNALDVVLEKEFGVPVVVSGNVAHVVNEIAKVYGKTRASGLLNLAGPSVITEWQQGKAQPNRWQLRTIATLWDVTQLLLSRGGQKSARDWLSRPNPYLNNYTPYEVFKVDPQLVEHAALRYFGGYG